MFFYIERPFCAVSSVSPWCRWDKEFGIENAQLAFDRAFIGKARFCNKGYVMEEEKKVAQPKSRREFMKTTAQVAVAAPAVAMLLQASTKPANAQAAYELDTNDTFNGDAVDINGSGQDG